MSNLIVYTAKNIEDACRNVKNKTLELIIPVDVGPTVLNHINIAAYTLLKEAIHDLNPYEIRFLGSLSATNMVSARQRARLKNMMKRHLNIDLDKPKIGEDHEIIDLEAA